MIKKWLPLDKVILVGDIHFGVYSNSAEWLLNISEFFYKILIPFAKEAVIKYGRDKVTIILAGDINDIKQAIATVVQNKQIEIFEELASICDVYIDIGNHDTPFKENPKVNSIRALKLIDGVHIVDEPTILETVAKERVLITPWVSSKEKELEVINNFDAEYLIAHTEIAGFHYEGVPVDESKHNPIEAFSKFKRVWSGHIHKKQEKENIVFIGTPCQVRKSEADNENGIWFIDFENDKEAFIPNEVSPKFTSLNVFTLMNMTISEANKFVKNNYVSVKVPTDMMYILNMANVSGVLEGYRSLNAEPIIKKNKSDVLDENMIGSEGIKEISVDIGDKLTEFIDQIESVRLTKEKSVTITDKWRDKLKKSVTDLYRSAKNKDEDIEI